MIDQVETPEPGGTENVTHFCSGDVPIAERPRQ